VDPGDDATVRAWVAALAGRPGVVVADDVGAPPEWAALSAVPTGSRSAVALVAAAAAVQFSAHYQGPVAALRRARSGLLLCPGPGDADVLGVRLPRTPLPLRPGSGWLVDGPVLDRVQVARRVRPGGRTTTDGEATGGAATDGAATDDDQSSSSAGPISCVAYQASS
jgi:S-DNA-T family DNA segregation ATPase FtsK/SpoIIIE